MKLCLIVILIYRLAICNGHSPFMNCANVRQKYNDAVQVHNNQTTHSDDAVPSLNDSELLANRIQRAHILLTTSQLLSQDYQVESCAASPLFESLMNVDSYCLPKYPVRPCSVSPELQYRPVDGKLKYRCKNTGKSFEPYDRMERAHYNDCLWEMRKAKSGIELPTPRTVINQVVRNYVREHRLSRVPNMLSVMMGQYIAHDIASKRDTVPESELQCCSNINEQPLPVETRHPACCPIVLPENDPDFQQFPNVHCLNLIRSDLVAKNPNKLGPADQLNEVTAFLDHSNLYGNTEEVYEGLQARDGNGRIITNEANILPERNGVFFLGDSRLRQTSQLMMVHSIPLREHNRIAGELKELYPRWKDQKILEEARRINVAEYQRYVYKEWLPAYLHPSIVKLLDDPISSFKSPILDNAVYNEFSASIFRLFHTFLPHQIVLIDESGANTTHPLNSMIRNMNLVRNRYDDIARGLLYQPIATPGPHPDLFHELFSTAGGPGIDLISIDVQRGRDHGIPPYTVLLEMFSGQTVTTFEDLAPQINPRNIELLRRTYESVEDIDSLIGCMLETPMEGTLLGRTAQMVMMRQFRRIKASDPYFYDNVLSPNPFTPAQLKEIEKVNSNSLYCWNSGVQYVPKEPSFAPDDQFDFTPCKSLEKIYYGHFP